MVMARALKKPPVTPLRKASGVNTMMVASDEPSSGRAISLAASSTVAPPSLNLRVMYSSMTTISSTTSPTAAAMPPSVMMFRLSPSAISNRAVEASTAGSRMATTSTKRRLRRNTYSTRPASRVPIRMASRTLEAAARTRSDWS